MTVALDHLYCTLHETSDRKAWNLEFNGEIVAVRCRTPRTAMQDHLDSKGIRGTVIFRDAVSGKPRSLIHLPIAPVAGKGSPRTAEETSRHATTPDTVPAV